MRNCAACMWRARDCSSRFCPLPRCPYDDRVPWWETIARRMKARREEKELRAEAMKMLAPWVQGREV